MSIPSYSINQQLVRPLMIFQRQRNGTKNQMYKAIKDGNVEKVRSLIKEFNVDPNEEISVAGYNWTALHYSCNFKQPQILELFVNIIYKKNMNFYQDVMNIKTKDGWTPLMISVIYKSTECLNILIEYGGIELLAKDYNNLTSLKLAENYQAKECFDILSKLMTQYNNSNGMVPINSQLFKQKESILSGIIQVSVPKEMDKETETKFKKLLEEGYRIPCVICQVEFGYIKYTDCCGQPMHGHCQTEKITSCPVCRNQKYTLCTDILYPDRAFSLEKP